MSYQFFVVDVVVVVVIVVCAMFVSFNVCKTYLCVQCVDAVDNFILLGWNYTTFVLLRFVHFGMDHFRFNSPNWNILFCRRDNNIFFLFLIEN